MTEDPTPDEEEELDGLGDADDGEPWGDPNDGGDKGLEDG